MSDQLTPTTGIPVIQPYPMPVADALPPNTATWTPDPRRAVLLLHDLQEYFLSPFPPGTSPVSELVSNAAAIRRRCADLGIPVAYTAQPGAMTPHQRGLLSDFWGPGMTAGPAHRDIVEPLAPRPGDWRFTKWRYSAFHNSELLLRIRGSGRDQIIVCGVYAHVGILMTVSEAFAHDIEPFLVADAVADFSAEDHHMALRYAARRCAVVRTTQRLLDELGPAGGRA
ncbi:isochorismatase family protein [Actinoplanes sp. NPDC049265]|uniref:isochorismatase family protein n=1 Tax=Actinoplanes sp. NPDC049265 TaxID=3363902 RepID=UPI003712D3D3